MKKKISCLLIITGLCMFVVGVFFYLNSTRIISCTMQKGIFYSEKKYEIDIHNKVFSYESITKTDYSDYSDDDFNKLCEDEGEDGVIEENEVTKRVFYCDKKNKKYIHSTKLFYRTIIDNNFYKKLFIKEFEFVDKDLFFDEEAWIESMQKEGFQCN